MTSSTDSHALQAEKPPFSPFVFPFTSSLTYVDARLAGLKSPSANSVVEIDDAVDRTERGVGAVGKNDPSEETRWLDSTSLHGKPIVLHPSPLRLPIPVFLGADDNVTRAHELGATPPSVSHSKAVVPLQIPSIEMSAPHISSTACSCSSSISSYAGSIHIARLLPAPLRFALGSGPVTAAPRARARILQLRVDTKTLPSPADAGADDDDDDNEILPFTPGTPGRMKGYSRATVPADVDVSLSEETEQASPELCPWTALVTPAVIQPFHSSPTSIQATHQLELVENAERIKTASDDIVIDEEDRGSVTASSFTLGFDVTKGLEQLLQQAGAVARARRGST